MKFVLYPLAVLYVLAGVLLAILLVFAGCLDVCPTIDIWLYEILIILILWASAFSSWKYAREGGRTAWYFKLLAFVPLFASIAYFVRTATF